MTLPDFVSVVLEYLATQANGGNFDTANHSSAPVRINRDDSIRLDTDTRTQDFDLTEASVVGVSSSPSTSNEPVGTEFDFKVKGGVSVRIEAVHESETFPGQDGGVADADEFRSLKDEVRRAILVEREWPTADNWITHLSIEQETNNSSAHRNYYRYDFDVWFHGYEDLP